MYSGKSIKNVLVAVGITLAILVMCNFTQASEKRYKIPRDQLTIKNAKYLETYDGDTFFVDIPGPHPIFGKRLGIRVAGVDTPEIRTRNKFEKKLGLLARDFTKSILENGKNLELIDCVRGKYFRIVCKVKNSKTEDLTTDLLKNGLAEPYGKK